MKILILGSTGFIGKNMAEYFQNKNGYYLSCPKHQEMDALDENSVVQCLKNEKPDVVLNCLDSTAGEGYFERRLRMFMNLAHHSELYGKMIYFGSGAEYGRQREVENVNEDEIGRVIPDDSYGLALYLMNDFARKSNNIYNLRLFGIFGKYELWQQRFISNAICKNLYDSPITIRQDREMSYTDIADLELVTEWFMKNTPKYHDYNIVQKTYLLSELAHLVNMKSDNPTSIHISKEGMGLMYVGNGERLFDECHLCFRRMEESIEILTAWYKSRLDTIDKEVLLYH